MPKEKKRGGLNVIQTMGNHCVRLMDPVDVRNKEAILNSPPRRIKTGMRR